MEVYIQPTPGMMDICLLSGANGEILQGSECLPEVYS